MPKAWLYLRHKTDRRYQIFTDGLKCHGFSIVDGLPPPDFGPGDIFVTWNRLAAANRCANAFQARGQRVLVAENAEGATATVDSLTVASARFAELTTELKSISMSLDSIVTRVEEGEGSLGKAIGDDVAHDEFVAAVKEVRELVADIREDPKSFVRFSIF